MSGPGEFLLLLLLLAAVYELSNIGKELKRIADNKSSRLP